MRAGVRTPWRLWVATVAVGVASVLFDALGAPVLASVTFLVTLAVFLGRAAIRADLGRRVDRWMLFVPGAACLIGGLWLFKYGAFRADPRAAALTATGAQLALFALSLHPADRPTRVGRTLLVLLGHAAAFLGTYSLLVDPGGANRVAGAAYSGALLLLSLDAYWVHRAAKLGPTLRSWEAPFLLFFAGGSAVLLLAPLPITPDPYLTALLWLKVSLLLALGLLAGPPHLPERLRAKPGGVLEFFSQGIALGIVLNAMLVLLILNWPFLALPVVGALTAWLVLAVLGEYWALIHGRNRLRHPPPKASKPRFEPLTVVIAAMNEAATIERTVQAALILPRVEQVIVIVAKRSKDATFETVAALVSGSRSRLRLLRGTGSSKADDLNEAWRSVTTRFALILDADETVDVRTLGDAFSHFDDASVGIVQGRKAARDPTRTTVDRFVALERRFSTLFDQTLQSDRFDAAHFAGSAALLRTEIPREAGGWSSVTLTEDIEFTVRLYLRTRWRIVYEPSFLAYEESPRKLDSFLRQRGRWARGWSQVASLHLAAVLRHRSLPLPRKLGLSWQLLTAVSAPWSIFFPTLVALWIWQAPVFLPSFAAIILGLVLLPSRLVTYTYPYFHDPVKPHRMSLAWAGRVVVAAYLWVLAGWMLQLQALYLELSDAPKVWHSTRDLAPTKPGGVQPNPAPALGAA